MQYLTIIDGGDYINVAKLRGSSIGVHDVLPLLEGVGELETNVGSFYNTSFYSGSLFTEQPSDNYLECTTNTGLRYYVPSSMLGFSISHDSDDVLRVSTDNGFEYEKVGPYATVGVTFNTPVYDFGTLLVLSRILDHSKVVFRFGSLSELVVPSFSMPSSLYDVASMGISFSFTRPLVEQPLVLVLPCYALPSYVVDSSSYVTYDGVTGLAYGSRYLSETFTTYSFAVTLSSWDMLLHGSFNLVDEGNNPLGEFYVDGSYSFTFAPDINVPFVLFKSKTSIISHIVNQ